MMDMDIFDPASRPLIGVAVRNLAKKKESLD
jgi:hypothetical protein